MKLFKKIIDKNKALYWGLIITFGILYFFTAFISWYHSIVFFNISNAIWLSVIFSLVAEIGQAGILFAILLTKNKQRFLAWTTMIILTSLQIIGNVVACFKFIEMGSGENFIYFQKSILFWVQTSSPEMIKIIIAWVSGSLLPLIALSMTGLVATNLQLKDEQETTKPPELPQLSSEEDDEFGSLDLTDLEPDKSDFLKSDDKKTDIDDIDETGIGGEPTPIQEKQITDFISKEEPKVDLSDLEHAVDELIEETPENEKLDYLDEEVANLTPELEEQKQDLNEEIVYTVSELAKEKAGKIEPTLNRWDYKPIDDKQVLPDFKFTPSAPEIVSQQFEKDLIVPNESPKKKRGRRVKQKETLVESKKEQGFLQEKVSVSVPLEESKSKIEPPKQITELLQNINKPIIGESITEPIKDEEISPESLLIPSELKSYIDGGVEVIDAKAIPLKEEKVKKKLKWKVDKWGIPIIKGIPGSRENFDHY